MKAKKKSAAVECDGTGMIRDGRLIPAQCGGCNQCAVQHPVIPAGMVGMKAEPARVVPRTVDRLRYLQTRLEDYVSDQQAPDGAEMETVFRRWELKAMRDGVQRLINGGEYE